MAIESLKNKYLTPPPPGFVHDKNHNLILPETKLKPTILITGDVGQELFKSTAERLATINEKSAKSEIDVTLSSIGGSVYYGFGIHDLLAVKAEETTVNTTVYGTAQSMAVLILQAGSNRAMSRNSELLIHPFAKKIDGIIFVDTLQADAEQTKKMNLRYYKLLSDRVLSSGGNLSAEEIENMALAKQNSGTFLSAKEALNLKIIDAIV